MGHYNREGGPLHTKSYAFAIRIVKMYQFLCESKKEFVLSKQVLRSGTSIGANIRESKRGQTIPDFYTKLTIALKEADETADWLELLYKTGYIDDTVFKSLNDQCKSIRVMLVASCKTAKNSQTAD